jgi:hypothetical protein
LWKDRPVRPIGEAAQIRSLVRNGRANGGVEAGGRFEGAAFSPTGLVTRDRRPASSIRVAGYESWRILTRIQARVAPLQPSDDGSRRIPAAQRSGHDTTSAAAGAGSRQPSGRSTPASPCGFRGTPRLLRAGPQAGRRAARRCAIPPNRVPWLSYRLSR